MGPSEPVLSQGNLKPLAIFTGYLLNAGGLTAFLAYSVLYRAYRSSPPPQVTRSGATSRTRHVCIYIALATLSLAITWYYMASFFRLSYRAWSHDANKNEPVLALGQWLKDSKLFREAWEIAVEKGARFWWAQQIFFGAATWSMFLGVEGRRRSIPHLWAFMLLAQTVAVSFAMNLFFLAILLTPVSRPSHPTEKSSAAYAGVGIAAKKLQSPLASSSPRYEPPSIVYIAILLTCYVGVFLLPFSTSTSYFMPILLVPHLVLFLPIYLDRIAPRILSRVPGPSSPRLVYQFMAYSSVALFVKQTIVAFLDNEPGTHTHRHSAVLESQRLQSAHYGGPVDRSPTALGRILKSLGDHPAATSVGWDVILCGFSLVMWASIRRLEITKITGNVGLNRTPDFDKSSANGSKRVSSSQPSLKATASFHADHVGKESSSGSTRRRHFVTKSGDEDTSMSPVSVDDGEEEMSERIDSGAVSCALFMFGGLGAVASGVLGAETERF